MGNKCGTNAQNGLKPGAPNDDNSETENPGTTEVRKSDTDKWSTTERARSPVMARVSTQTRSKPRPNPSVSQQSNFRRRRHRIWRPLLRSSGGFCTPRLRMRMPPFVPPTLHFLRSWNGSRAHLGRHFTLFDRFSEVADLCLAELG